jgi:Protein of unknown function (DUF3999)
VNRTLVALLALSISSGIVRAQAITPKDFAYTQVATPQRDAAAYRVALPLPVYQNTFNEDLADLRVFNSDGVAVPYSLSRPAPQSQVQSTPVDVPMFPLREGAQISIDGVHLSINSAGSAVNLQTQNGSTTTSAVRQYLLDTRALDTALAALQLSLPDGAPDFTGRLGVEASDDLAAWRSVLTSAPIANLHANGQRLVENRVEFAPTKAKFWRLSWRGISPNFELTNILVEPAGSVTEPDRTSLEVSGVADQKDPRQYTFDLGARPPVSRVNLILPDANSVIDAELSTRSTENSPWRTVLHSGFYRLKTPDAEQQNSALVVSPDTDRYWRARIVGAGTLPQSPLRLHVEWIPNEVTFLAQGHSPFVLAYGDALARRAEADLSNLPKAMEIAPAVLGSVQVSGGPKRLIAKPAPFPAMRVLLWGVLLLAVLVLGWMAYRLSDDPKNI